MRIFQMNTTSLIVAFLLPTKSNFALVNAQDLNKCVDEENWSTYDPSGIWTGKTCSDIVEKVAFWCNYLSSYPSTPGNQLSTEACCICGGGVTFEITDTSKSEPPSPTPIACEDDGSFFWGIDSSTIPETKFGCETVTPGFCDDLSNIWHDGKNVMGACCVCGSGSHIPFPPSEMPTSLPSSDPISLHSDHPSFAPSSAFPTSNSPSINPTISTFEKCTDFEGYSLHDPNNFWSDHTCSDFTELPDFWCNFFANYTGFDPYTYEAPADACCACGGGSKVTPQPSESPSTTPTKCIDQPGWMWGTQPEHSCAVVTPAFCDTLSSIWFNGKNVELSCCACGGGDHIPFVPSSLPSAKPSVSIAPSIVPSSMPSDFPLSEPSSAPTKSAEPSSFPSSKVSTKPSYLPSIIQSEIPSNMPSLVPSVSVEPSFSPTPSDSSKPSLISSTAPSLKSSDVPSLSVEPSFQPSIESSSSPSSTFAPSNMPSSQPVDVASMKASHEPSDLLSAHPSLLGSLLPSSSPSIQCLDYPQNWHDVEGERFNCTWYAVKENCFHYGNNYANPDFFGFTAAIACCVCGGGNRNDFPSQLPSVQPTSLSISSYLSSQPSAEPSKSIDPSSSILIDVLDNVEQCPEGRAVDQEECFMTATLIGGDHLIYKKKKLNVNDWSNTPCGCFLYARMNDGTWIVDYDTGSQCVRNNRARSVCKAALSSDLPPVEVRETQSHMQIYIDKDKSKCPEEREVDKTQCLQAGTLLANQLGFTPVDHDIQFLRRGEWDDTPCGCFLWSNKSDGSWSVNYDKGSICVPHARAYPVCKAPPVTIESPPVLTINSVPYQVYAIDSAMECPEGDAIEENVCFEAANLVGFFSNSNAIYHTISRSNRPCGCFLWRSGYPTGRIFYNFSKTCAPYSTARSVCKAPLHY